MEVNFAAPKKSETSEKKREKTHVDWNLTTRVKCGERRYYSEGSRA